MSLIHNEERLRAVSSVMPLKTDWDGDFDRIARLAAKAVNSPTSMITLIADDNQTFIGVCGPPEGMGEDREGSNENSICRHTVLSGAVVSITNTSQDPMFSNNPIVCRLGIQAYLGIPLVTPEGHAVGSICVMDYQPRDWSLEEIDLLRDYAAVAAGYLESVARLAKTRVAFDIALHDLKTPLSGLTMASCLISEKIDLLPVELHPLVEVVGSTTAAAVRLVNILSETQRNETINDCLEPVEVIREVIAKLNWLAKEKDITFYFDHSRTNRVRAPRWVLEQILFNLAGNSIKFGPVGSVISIRLVIDADTAHFHVSDEGPGFAECDLNKMYHRYARLSALPTGGESSTGLGLSIVKRLAVQNGGLVVLISCPGEGAEFRVSLPLSL